MVFVSPIAARLLCRGILPGLVPPLTPRILAVFISPIAARLLPGAESVIVIWYIRIRLFAVILLFRFRFDARRPVRIRVFCL